MFGRIVTAVAVPIMVIGYRVLRVVAYRLSLERVGEELDGRSRVTPPQLEGSGRSKRLPCVARTQEEKPPQVPPMRERIAGNVGIRQPAGEQLTE